MKYDKFRFDYFLDFILCENKMIFKLFQKQLSIKDCLIVLVKRRIAK